jgi:hypothetical protein
MKACLTMAQFGRRVSTGSLKTIENDRSLKNDCNGWEPHVRTAKSAAAAPRRARQSRPRAGSLQRSLQRQKTIPKGRGALKNDRSANEPAPGGLPTSKRANVDGLQPSPEASEVTGAVTCQKNRFSATPQNRPDAKAHQPQVLQPPGRRRVQHLPGRRKAHRVGSPKKKYFTPPGPPQNAVRLVMGALEPVVEPTGWAGAQKKRDSASAPHRKKISLCPAS